MFNKHNLKFSVISILLTLNLNIGTLAMFPSDEHKISESISGIKFCEKCPINHESNIRNPKTSKSSIIDSCINILKLEKCPVTTKWILYIYNMVINNKCPSDDFIKRLESIPECVDQRGTTKRCPYCNGFFSNGKCCDDINCIFHWNEKACIHRTVSVRNKSGRFERLCLLPAIILEICKDIEFYPPAKAWAVYQLMEGKKTEWNYVDNMFNSFFYKARIIEIKESLNSAYKNISINDVIDAVLYYENF